MTMTAPFRLTGEVTAPDGTGYQPLVWADWHNVARVLDAVTTCAHEAGDTYTLRVDRGEGTPLVVWETYTPEVRP